MITFADQLRHANPKYAIADISDIRGGFWTVDTKSALEVPEDKLKDGMLAYVKNEDQFYQYHENEGWQRASFNSSGIPVHTTTTYESQTSKPEEYLWIRDPSLQGSVEDNQQINIKKGGDYVDILFSALRSLQHEVAKLKNTFYYGIQSYNGTDTASSNIIINEEQEEQEPLWALDPEDLSEFEDHSVLVDTDCELKPKSNIDIKNNCVEIYNEVSQTIDLNFDISEESKQCVYIIADVKQDSTITLELSGEDELTINLEPYLTNSKCNILVIINRKIFNEDTEQWTGKNYIWVQITDKQGNVITTGYYYNGELYSSEKIQNSRYYVNEVLFSNLTLYRCNFYSKQSGFTNDDVLSSLTPNDQFAFKAAHITIRSVETKNTLLQLKDRLMENELVLVEDESQLYIKNKNQLISLSSGKTTDDTIMTNEEILQILKDAGYITVDDKLSSVKINDIEKLTFIHSESNQKFNVSINSDGKLLVNQKTIINPDTNVTPSMQVRGAVGKYTLGSYDTVTNATIYGDSSNPKAYGDRVRFGSWYIPKANQTTFGSSHDFIELANSGSKDYPLEGARLFLIKGQIITETENGKSYPYLIGASIDKFILTGTIKSGSTYLIRGQKHNENNFVINVDSYDYELRDPEKELYSLEGVVAMILLNASDSEDVQIKISDTYTANGEHVCYFTKQFYDNSTATGFKTQVRSDLIDCIGFDNPSAFRIEGTNKQGKDLALGKKSYNIYENCITKDLFELDPSRQGFLSLTTNTYESTGYRLDKVNTEYLDLNNRTISFLHSDEEAEIARFTPKASCENKTICTDKTPLDLVRPNMVSCFYGIDMQTTRCFNWISGSDQNEYVWIRKQGELQWNRFESYKGEKSEISDNNNDYETDEMNRVKYSELVINSVYKRMKGIFPGSHYNYVSHKCVIYIQNAPTDNPVNYEYIVGATLNNGNPNTSKCSNIQTFTLYPSDWEPMIYLVSDQQGFEWTEYQVWAAAAKQILKQINQECNNETKRFPVLINTGDCTQNGTRYNEWLDYYNAGYCLFDHLEQLNVVGNNDLANAYDHSVLGTGNDEGKSNPYYFHLVNCYQLDDSENYSYTSEYNKMWNHPLIVNNIYFPSTYYTYFGNYGYLLVNSELTLDSCKGLYKVLNDERVYNLYTGYLQNSDSINSENKSFKETISVMLDKLSGKNIIVACHEMPITVMTHDNFSQTKMAYTLDRSCNGKYEGGVKHTSLVGSHLNRLHYNTDWDKDDNYWFSQLLQNKGVKLCLGGHKHSYTCSYPIYENLKEIKNFVNQLNTDDSEYIKFNSPDLTTYDPSKLFISYIKDLPNGCIQLISDYEIEGGNDNIYLYRGDDSAYPLLISNNPSRNYVTYFMVQATGYKLKSNKELPSTAQIFSVIRPNTDVVNSKPHFSQESPMFATIIKNKNEKNWDISLYRIVNIKQTQATKIVEFSSRNYSKKPMVTERLVLNYNTDQNKNDNYWYTEKDPSNYEFDYTLNASDRCWGKTSTPDNTYKVQTNNGQIDYSEYTLTV